MHSAVPSLSKHPLYVYGPDKSFTKIAVLSQVIYTANLFFCGSDVMLNYLQFSRLEQ